MLAEKVTTSRLGSCVPVKLGMKSFIGSVMVSAMAGLDTVWANNRTAALAKIRRLERAKGWSMGVSSME